jgi:hypothetical protein
LEEAKQTVVTGSPSIKPDGLSFDPSLRPAAADRGTPGQHGAARIKQQHNHQVEIQQHIRQPLL